MTYERSFYYPHEQADTAYTGEITDPITGEVSTLPSMTKQSFVAECDINNILAEYKTSGQIRHINEKAAQGMFLDLPESTDYQEALNTVIQAENSFAALPSAVRSRFGNDPELFLAFLHDPANQDEAIKMGLATDTRTVTEATILPTGEKQGDPPSEGAKPLT